MKHILMNMFSPNLISSASVLELVVQFDLL
jgi:hypothetical protein